MSRRLSPSHLRRTALVACLALCLQCKSSTEGDGEVPDGPEAPASDASDGSLPAADAAVPDGGGTGTVSGSADGAPFGSVATSYVIGAPDSASTTVVFVFSKPVACADLGSPGWDRRITDATQFLEIKFFGTAPGTFRAVTTVTPAPGEASVNYTLSSTSSTPREIGSSGGAATLGALVPNASATGSFSLEFDTNRLNGTFSAVFCPGGHEP